MPEQDQHRAVAIAVRGPEVVDLAEAQVLDGEAGGLQALRDQSLAAGIIGGDRGAGDQFAGEIEDVAHGSLFM